MQLASQPPPFFFGGLFYDEQLAAHLPFKYNYMWNIQKSSEKIKNANWICGICLMHNYNILKMY